MPPMLREVTLKRRYPGRSDMHGRDRLSLAVQIEQEEGGVTQGE